MCDALSGDGAVALMDVSYPTPVLTCSVGSERSNHAPPEGEIGRRLPVVMISDQTASAHRDYAFAAGVDRFLEKWLAPARLLELVESLCPLTAEPSRPGSGTLPRPTSSPV